VRGIIIVEMKRWSKILEKICDVLGEKDLYILEADQELNWYGLPLKDLCGSLDLTDSELFKVIKGKVQEEVKGEGYIALVSPVNLYVDIYPYDRRRFSSGENRTRPFDVTREHFRVGFFKTKEDAVNFFLRVESLLKEEGINLHLFYG
jgi:hypothetical protein